MGQESIINNAKDAVEKYNNSVVSEQEMLNKIREYIKNDGNVEETNGITISVVPDTTGVSKKVIITIAVISENGIKNLKSNAGIDKIYAEGTNEILETCEITKNGTYTFSVEDEKGQKVSKDILINNILEGIISISASETQWTKNDVTVTVEWPNNTGELIKQISINNGETWDEYTGPVVITENCTIKARLLDSITQTYLAESLTINKIDKTAPTAPSIEGESTSYVASTTINVSKESIEIGSGVAYYEYYLVNNGAKPTSSTIATGKIGNTANEKSKTFSTNYEGDYIYFRAVDKVGNIGEWSNSQRLWIDINKPIIRGGSISKVYDGTALIPNFDIDANGPAKIVSVEIIPEGGRTEVGSSEVTCTVTKETGISASLTVTVTITPQPISPDAPDPNEPTSPDPDFPNPYSP